MDRSNGFHEAGGYYYTYSKETIRKYLNLPTKMKLEWLEEVNRFLYHTMTPENRAIWERFRRGETF